MMACPKKELISAYVDDALNASTKQKIDVHLRSCSICQEQVRHFEELNLSIQEWADDRVPIDSEISASYEDVVPSHLEKRIIPESDKIVDRLVRKLRNTPQKVLWFQPQHFGMNEEYLTRNQKLSEHITPQWKVEGLAAYSVTPFEKLYCYRLSSANDDLVLEFRIGSRRGRDLATLFLGGSTRAYPDRFVQITLLPVSFLRNIGLEWAQTIQQKDDGNLVLTVHFDEKGWLENKNEHLAFISPEAAKTLHEYLINGRALVEALKAEVIDESVANLLKQIQSNLPPELEIRLKQLREKRQAETLTESEHAELLTLLDKVEQWNISRIEALSHFARITGRRLADLAKELGLGNNEII